LESVNCKKYHKLINLYLDGRLSSEDEYKLKEHLATCELCRSRLEFFKTVENVARDIDQKEPERTYCERFPDRVMARIENLEKRKGWPNILEKLKSILPVAGPRLKIAAGIVTVAIVIIVGKIYLDHHSQQIIRSGRLVPPAEEKIPPIPTEENMRNVPTEKARSTREEVKKADQKSLSYADKEAVELESEPESDEGSYTAGGESPTTRVTSVKSVISESRVQGVAPRGKTDVIKTPEIMGANFNLNGKIIPLISEHDTLIIKSDLTYLISAWRDYLGKTSGRQLEDIGYEQVATGYYLLARITGDRVIISEGTGVIKEYMRETSDSTVKECLREKILKLNTLPQK
jgi:hypothetical protein